LHHPAGIGIKAPERLNVVNLKGDLVKQRLAEKMKNKLSRQSTNTDASDVIEPTTHRHTDWFDENCIQLLLNEMHKVHCVYLTDPKSETKRNQMRTVCPKEPFSSNS
jgi:hypothetical protein